MNARTAAIIAIIAAVSSYAEGLSKLITYVSPVDRSEQAYGVYLPDAASPPGGYPVVLHAHGYGWWVGTGFSQWQQAWADAHGWVLVQLNARGPNFYWGIGDIATKEVIDDLAGRFGIDRGRVYITGGSMGGTGAFRQGVMHPDYIAAAAGVDGWTDFHEWHWHWYARKDQRDEIEEFRRPLLEAASPLFLAERALWGDVHVIADGRDDVVYPWQGVDLANRLRELGLAEGAGYSSGLTLNYDKGHGGGYDLGWIYDYFLGRAERADSGRFRLSSTVLEHGSLYWARMDALHQQGAKALVDCSAEAVDAAELQASLGDLLLLDAFTDWRTVGPTPAGQEGEVWGALPSDEAGVVNVITENLDGLTLELPASPVGGQERVAVFADGIPCYVGPATNLRLEALRDETDSLCGWLGFPAEADAGVTTSGGTRKSQSVCGPLGHAFVTPFVVCYGTVGAADLMKQHRDEATAFCNGWNGFMVHGPGLQALPEDALSPADIEGRNLIVYGTLETSRLLSRAQGIRPMPVEVHTDRIVVRDPLTGDREYRGRKYGAFTVYPNPITEGRTYLVVCKGRFATQPPNASLQGLEFDLEKLHWGFSDYVVFNTDTGELPHVMNVNNKPPVTCYEAGYFVEAGYFDQYWQPDRFVTVDRAARTRPDGVRLMRVAEVRLEEAKRSLPVWGSIDGEPVDPERQDLPNPIRYARVRIVDGTGRPVRQARVTGEWVGAGVEAETAVALSDGNAYFACPAWAAGGPVPRFRVLNVMATGAEHEFASDCLEGGAWVSEDGALAVRATPVRLRVDRMIAATPGVELQNCGARELTAEVRFVSSAGATAGGPAEVVLAPGERTTRRFRWMPYEGASPGPHDGQFEVTADGRTVVCPVRLEFPVMPDAPVRFVSLAGKDIVSGEPYEIKGAVHNLDRARGARLQMTCSLVSGARRMGTRDVVVPPGETVEVIWTGQPGDAPLPRGEHVARVAALGANGVSGCCTFAVR